MLRRGVARILHWEPQKLSAEGLRLAESAEGGEDWGGLGERRELPQRGPGGAPAANAFLAYVRPTEHFW